LDDGCGVWRTVGEKILRKIDNRVREPGWVLGWGCCGVNYVLAFAADDLAVIPNMGPEEVDVGCRPVVEVLVRAEVQTVFLVDLSHESEESARPMRVIRGEQRHGRVSCNCNRAKLLGQPCEVSSRPSITRLFLPRPISP